MRRPGGSWRAMTAPTDGLFCYNDRMAMGAYRAAAELGLSIPADLSVVGFDDQELIAANLYPGLTTVALPHYEMGAWATEHLIDAIEGKADLSLMALHPTILSCPLVSRESVAAPRHSPQTKATSTSQKERTAHVQ